MLHLYLRKIFLSALIIIVSNSIKADSIKVADSANNSKTKPVLLNKLQSGTSSNVVYYVKANASGLNNGSSWTNAFTNLSSALSISIAGDSIKISKGTYTSQANFLFFKDSTIIFGGYPNTGNPSNADRDWSLNQTIIDGSGIYPNLFTNQNNLSPYTQINGLIIQNGNNNGSTSGPNASIYPGVGVSLSNSSPTISNCVFRNNTCLSPNFGGSTVSCRNNSNPRFNNCFFINGFDFSYGTIYCTTNSTPIFSNCVFTGNIARTVVFSEQSSPKFYNCNFFKNDIGFNQLPSSIEGNGTMIGVSTSNITIANSIFYLNKMDQNYDTIDVKLISSTLNISNTITQNYDYGNSLLAANPKFKDTSSIEGPDGLYFTQDDGLQLTNPCSIAINKGNNATVGGNLKDILGNNRVFESVVDLGAYEMQTNLTNVPQVLYVNSIATGLNNGTSWANAFTNLQNALIACSDTIKVAKGTYFPSNANEYVSFWLEKSRIILGGFPNIGNPSNLNRNPTLYPTILSGSLPNGTNLKSYIIVHGKNIDSTSILDGFIIKDAKQNPNFDAGLTLDKKGNCLLKNIVFKNTLLDYSFPAIMIKDNSKPKFIDCKLDSSNGIINATNSSPTFKTCIFQNSYGIINYKSKIKIDSCLFFKTRSTAIYNSDSSDIFVNNSKFYGLYNVNTANTSNWTGSIVNNASSPIVTNCFFSDSTRPDSGGSIANYNNSKPIFTKCEFRNGNAFYFGGTCYNDNSSPIFNKCVFVNSKASSAGGVFYNKNYSSPKIVNCIASNCSGDGSFMFSEKSFPYVINTSIVNALAGNIHVFVNADSSFLKLSNSILWNNLNSNITSNKDILNRTDPVLQPSFAIVKNSITQSFGVNGQNGNLVGSVPNFRNITNPAGFDNTFYTTDDGLKLSSCSPALNVGSNNEINGYSSDIVDNNRIFGSIVDLGAYEFQGLFNNSQKTAFVNIIANGANDGTSWTNAYNNLQDAILNPCLDTIKIAMGIYKADINNRDISFAINRGIKIYGSYPNTGFPTDAQRNINTHPTILSGDIGILNDSTDNTKTLLKISCMDTSVVVDGIIIEKAKGEFPSYGGGINATNNKDLKLNNIILRNNYAFHGSAIYSTNNNIEISKCIFSKNTADGKGALNISNSISGNMSKVKNSIFINNFSNQSGGGVYCSTNTIFENSLLHKNNSRIGGGVYVEGDNQAKFTNCNFIKNNTISSSSGGSFGIGLHVSLGNGGIFSNPIIRNCIFSQNTLVNNYYTNNQSDWCMATQGFGGVQYNQPINIDYSATISIGATGNNNYAYNNISPDNVFFTNIDDAIGPDNKWFTQDDGLIPTICSMSYNKGDNAYVTNIPFDILDSVRVKNNIVDIGAYELSKVSVKIIASDTLVCPSSNVTFTAIPQDANSVISYTWYLNSNIVGTNSSSYSPISFNNNDTVKLKIIVSNFACNGLPDTVWSNKIVLRTLTSLVPSVNILSSNTSICFGSLITFNATNSNGGSNPNYQWQVNGVNVGSNSSQFSTNTLQNNDNVKVILTSSFSCAVPSIVNSNIINITVSPSSNASVTIVSSSNVICTGTVVNFTATLINGGSAPVYQWKVNGINVGTNNNIFSSLSLNNNDIVSLAILSNSPCVTNSNVTSNSINITVNPILVASISITASNNNFCLGGSSTFTAISTSGGASPVYQWQVNGINVGTNSNTFTSNTLTNNSQVKCIITSNATCVNPQIATSNIITMVINPVTVPGIIISTPFTNICGGALTTFTAVTTNGGTAPSYQWQVNGINVGVNSITFSSTSLNNNDQVKCILTSSLACVSNQTASSNVILVTVNGLTVIPTISISSNSSTICSGSSITFTAISTNGGSNPIYQWQINGINAGVNSNVFTTNSIIIYSEVKCIITSNTPCAIPQTATSNILTIIPNQTVTPSISIFNSSPIGCLGTTVSIFSNSFSGGTTPSYQWQVNGVNVGTNSNSFISNTLQNNDQVKCTLTSNANCAVPISVSSNTLVISFNPTNVLPTISINTPNNNICSNVISTFTATATNGGTTPTYQWQVNGVNVGTNSNTFTTNTLTNNAQVKCILTSSSSCVTTQTVISNLLNITVNPIVAPSISIASSATSICASSPVTFTATATNIGTTPIYQWQVNGVNVGTNAVTFTSSTLSNNDQVKCILTSNGVCVSPVTATSNTINVTVNSTVIPTVSIASNATAICSGSSITFNATSVNGGITPSYQWQVNGLNSGTNSNIFTSSTLTNASIVKVILTSSLACAVPQTATSNTINVTVNSTVNPIASFTATATNICIGNSITFTSTSTNVGTAPIYQWKKNGINVGSNSTIFTSNSFVTGDVITLSLTSNAACVSSATVTSNPSTITVATEIPTVTISGNTTVVINNATNITTANTFGGAAPTYQWQDSTNLHTWANIAGAINSTIAYTPADGNKLRCKMTSNSTCANGIVATSNVLVFNVTPSIIAPNPTGPYTLRYFPNPANKVLTIDSLQLSKEWESIKIVKADGATIETYPNYLVGKTKATLNVEMLRPGVYFLLLTRKQGVPVYLKFIKL